MTSSLSEHQPRTFNIYLVTLLPIVASYIPFVVLTILHIVINTPLVQVIVRTIKISQFAARVAPSLLRLDPWILVSPHRIAWNLLCAGYAFWSSRSWPEILCLMFKEVLKWNGVPQELLDTLNDLVGTSWFLGMLSSAPPQATAAVTVRKAAAELWTPTFNGSPFLTNDVAVGFSPVVGGLNVSG